jgi:hypothetical protein
MQTVGKADISLTSWHTYAQNGLLCRNGLSPVASRHYRQKRLSVSHSQSLDRPLIKPDEGGRAPRKPLLLSFGNGPACPLNFSKEGFYSLKYGAM